MTRTQRARLTQAALYVLILAVAVTLALLVDWELVFDNFFLREGFTGNWQDFVLTGVKNTLIYTCIAFGGGLLLGVFFALLKLSPVALYRWLATVYIEVFRGVPALIVILVMAFGVPIAIDWRPPGGAVGAGLVGLILVAGAYLAETMRAGIQAVPKGQSEAARSLGMSGPWTMISVVLPQAFRIVIPPVTNEFVLLLKDTSLLFVVGMTANQRELTTMARDGVTSGPSAQTATSFTLAALLYLVITVPLSRLVAQLEKRQRRSR